MTINLFWKTTIPNHDRVFIYHPFCWPQFLYLQLKFQRASILYLGTINKIFCVIIGIVGLGYDSAILTTVYLNGGGSAGVTFWLHYDMIFLKFLPQSSKSYFFPATLPPNQSFVHWIGMCSPFFLSLMHK